MVERGEAVFNAKVYPRGESAAGTEKKGERRHRSKQVRETPREVVIMYGI